MSILRAIVLGIIQGLTEFLPVSSTAHLRIIPALLRWDDPGAAFTAVIQLGTMAAVVIYFAKDLWNMTRAWFASLPAVAKGLRGQERKRFAASLSLDARLMWMVLLGTIPVAVLGVLFKDQIEGPFRDLRLIAGSLIVFGLVLGAADRFGARRHELEDMNGTDGLVIGLCQSLALIPGVSRSGSTMTGGLFRGLTREAAARYSFLLSVPAVVLSGLFELRHAFGGHLPIFATLVATVISFVVGYASIAGMLSFLRRQSNLWFTAYRVVAGLALLGFIYGGLIPRELVGH